MWVREEEVVDEAAQDDSLLDVFLSKVCAIRLG